MTTVTMNKLSAGYVIMHEAAHSSKPPNAYYIDDDSRLLEHINARSYLIKYLDGCPLPLYFYSYGMWEELTEEAAKKLDLLTGPNGYTIAKMFIAQNILQMNIWI